MKTPDNQPPTQPGKPATKSETRPDATPIAVRSVADPDALTPPEIDGACVHSRRAELECPSPIPTNNDPNPTLVTYRIHDLALVFPESTEKELTALTDSIGAQGQIHPAVLHEGMILDGRSRYTACNRLGINLLTMPLPENIDPVGYVAGANIARRQLSAAQKAVVAAKLMPYYEAEAAKRKQSLSGTRPNRNGPAPDVTESLPGPDERGEAREKAAKVTGVNARYVSDIVKIHREAPELFEAIASGTISIPKALKQLEQKPSERNEQPEGSTPDGFVAVLWDDDPIRPKTVPELSYGTKTYPNIGFFRLHAPGDRQLEAGSKHGLTNVAVFVVPVEQAAILENKVGRPFCKASCRFLTLSVRGTVPEPATVPNQLIEGGFDGVTRMIESMFPDSKKLQASAKHPDPQAWEYLPRQSSTHGNADDSGAVMDSAKLPEAVIAHAAMIPAVAEDARKASKGTTANAEPLCHARKGKATTVCENLNKLHSRVVQISTFMRSRQETSKKETRHLNVHKARGRATELLEVATEGLADVVASLGVHGTSNADRTTLIGDLPFSTKIIPRGNRANQVSRMAEISIALAAFLQDPAPVLAKSMEKVADELKRARRTDSL